MLLFFPRAVGGNPLLAGCLLLPRQRRLDQRAAGRPPLDYVFELRTAGRHDGEHPAVVERLFVPWWSQQSGRQNSNTGDIVATTTDDRAES